MASYFTVFRLISATVSLSVVYAIAVCDLQYIARRLNRQRVCWDNYSLGILVQMH